VIALAMLAGAFILAIGILLGRLLPERRKGGKRDNDGHGR
jgi:hypothetical protein